GRSSAGFSWGAGSSAYQTEGAWNTDGKGLSIWDAFAHKKGKIHANDTGDFSCEGYHRFKDDVSLMKDMKLNHYRFSISWPRILPTGVKSRSPFSKIPSQNSVKRNDFTAATPRKRRCWLKEPRSPCHLSGEQINEKGIRYYSDLIDLLLENQIAPMVTLYHWDLPQVLQERHGGWQNISTAEHFHDFADLCFQRFGSRVKHWITFNNPWVG
ncbi:unnamed protein product, partial [Tetraodon nigroviridis]